MEIRIDCSIGAKETFYNSCIAALNGIVSFFGLDFLVPFASRQKNITNEIGHLSINKQNSSMMQQLPKETRVERLRKLKTQQKKQLRILFFCSLGIL